MVIVAFNSALTLGACLASVPADCEVVIVDQQSLDTSVELARGIRPDATIIRNPVNTGYSAGCNLGARHARGETLVFLNPDAAFLAMGDPHVLAASVETRKALVGPVVRDLRQADVTIVKKWTTTVRETSVLLSPRRLRLGFKHLADDEYVSGPCLAVNASHFQAVGGFDERYFLYREEETLARRLKEIGVTSFLDPRVTVLHVGGASTSQVPEFAYRQWVRSEVLFYATHLPKPAAALVTLALVGRLLASSVVAPLVRVFGVRRGHPSRWYARALREVPRGWRAQSVTPPAPKADHCDEHDGDRQKRGQSAHGLAGSAREVYFNE